jgi:hypothetical protein
LAQQPAQPVAATVASTGPVAGMIRIWQGAMAMVCSGWLTAD